MVAINDVITESQVIVLSMYYFDGLTEGQIADRLGVCQQNVSRKLSKARTRLRKAGCPEPRRFRHDTRHVRNINPELLRSL